MEQLNSINNAQLTDMHDYALIVAWLVGACVAPDQPFIIAAAGAAALSMMYLKSALQTKDPHIEIVQYAGKGQGACLFCPGLHSNVNKSSRSQPVLDLAEQFATVVLFDYTAGASSLSDLVDDALRVLIVCGGPGECTIAGHSLGAVVAAHAAERARKAGWRHRIDLILFASPAHTGEGVTLPFAELVGVKVFATNMNMAETCRAISAPTTMVIVHAMDDPVISIEHARIIRDAAKDAGIEVHYTERKNGGHSLKRL